MDEGDIVCLSEIGLTELAIIDKIYDDIPGGVRLDREIGGFKSWNLSELILVGKAIK